MCSGKAGFNETDIGVCEEIMTQGKNSPIIRNADYSAFLKDVKQRIQTAQIKAAVRVNQALLGLYWDLGEQIIEKQRDATWGDGFLEQMSRDLLDEFPEMKGFSRRNLYDMRRWVLFWQQAVAKLGIEFGLQSVDQVAKQPASQFVRQLVAQIPWGHNLLIINKIEDASEALFYVRKTIEHNWSRAVLTHQIESGPYQRGCSLRILDGMNGIDRIGNNKSYPVNPVILSEKCDSCSVRISGYLKGLFTACRETISRFEMIHIIFIGERNYA